MSVVPYCQWIVRTGEFTSSALAPVLARLGFADPARLPALGKTSDAQDTAKMLTLDPRRQEALEGATELLASGLHRVPELADALLWFAASVSLWNLHPSVERPRLLLGTINGLFRGLKKCAPASRPRFEDAMITLLEQLVQAALVPQSTLQVTSQALSSYVEAMVKASFVWSDTAAPRFVTQTVVLLNADILTSDSSSPRPRADPRSTSSSAATTSSSRC